MYKDRFFNFFLVALCGVLGGISSFVIGNILLLRYSPRSFLVGLIIVQLIVLLLFIATLRYQAKKTNSETLVPLSIAVFVIFLFFAPAIVDKLDHYLSLPSVKEQNQAIKEVSNTITQTNIPYIIDEEESKKRTKKYGSRVNVVLVRTKDGFFEKNEIGVFVDKLPKKEIDIAFYTLGKKDVFGLGIDHNDIIFSCAPFDICREMGIDY
ncbi:hypothetical protein [Paenibacillus antibioticophila]|uniref:hypothetical protein n=1 Tax=Paenibacillus antibioticophila TaxID=1274374 RepID=UPI0005C9CB2D|nr:hypothetical protein [Paenibacillus antibioticophila]